MRINKGFYRLIIVMSCIFIAAGAALSLICCTMRSVTDDYPRTQAVISSIEKKAGDDEPEVMIDYSVNRRAYHEKLGYCSPSYKVGDRIEIRYDPEDPAKVYAERSFTVFTVLGLVILFSGVVTLWAMRVYARRT